MTGFVSTNGWPESIAGRIHRNTGRSCTGPFGASAPHCAFPGTRASRMPASNAKIQARHNPLPMSDGVAQKGSVYDENRYSPWRYLVRDFTVDVAERSEKQKALAALTRKIAEGKGL
jgi:hypothetical protein